MKTKALFTLLPLILTALTGCGGGEDTSTSESTDSSTSTSVIPPSTTTSTSTTPAPVVKKYTVTWNNWDGSLLEKDENVPENSMPEYNGATPTRPDDSTYTYTFIGWDPAVSKVTGNQFYTATYDRAVLTYTLDFDLQGGTSASYHGPVTVEAFSDEYFFFDVVKEGWNFRGWSYNNEKIFDEKGHQLANPAMAKNMTFKAIFSQTVKLTIMKNIASAGSVSGEGEYAYNTDVNVAAEAVEGYVFGGWYVDDIMIASSKKYNFKMWSKDVTIEARFFNMVHALTVKSNNVSKGTVQIMNEASPGYAKEETQYISSQDQVTIAANTLTKTRFLGWYDEDGNLIDTNAIYKFVMPNNDVTLYAKWNYFTITYELGGGTNNAANPDFYTIEDEVILLKNPTKENWIFNGWLVRIEDYDMEAEPAGGFYGASMENYIVTASWTRAVHDFSVCSSNDANGNVELEAGTGLEGETIRVTAYPEDDAIFKGWWADEMRVSTDLTYEFVMPDHAVNLEAQFVNKFEVGYSIRKISENKYSAGLYPQSKITDSELAEKINLHSIVDGEYRYYHCNYYEYAAGKWFRCEPVEWIKLRDGVFITSKILDAKVYYSSLTDKMRPCEYASSDIRHYLDDSMTERMFDINPGNIYQTMVENRASTTDSEDNPYCEKYSDRIYQKMYLPSYADMVNGNYGFPSNTKNSNARKASVTEYASELGCNGVYWTRSPYSQGNAKQVSCVTGEGGLASMNVITKLGIRPMAYIL